MPNTSLEVMDHHITSDSKTHENVTDHPAEGAVDGLAVTEPNNNPQTAAWELEFGVTDTRRFDHIPYIDEDVDEKADKSCKENPEHCSQEKKPSEHRRSDRTIKAPDAALTTIQPAKPAKI